MSIATLRLIPKMPKIRAGNRGKKPGGQRRCAPVFTLLAGRKGISFFATTHHKADSRAPRHAGRAFCVRLTNSGGFWSGALIDASVWTGTQETAKAPKRRDSKTGMRVKTLIIWLKPLFPLQRKDGGR
jgi:hypothetical protein